MSLKWLEILSTLSNYRLVKKHIVPPVSFVFLKYPCIYLMKDC